MASLAYRTDQIYEDRLAFSDFVVIPAARALLYRGDPVSIGARAFDLLVILASWKGEVVSKDAIFEHVWPTTTVDESNLRFQMTLVRKALGSHRDLIKTIPGRGYMLTTEFECLKPEVRNHPRHNGDRPPRPAPHEIEDALRSFLHVVARNPEALSVLDEVMVDLLRRNDAPRLAEAEPRPNGPHDRIAC